MRYSICTYLENYPIHVSFLKISHVNLTFPQLFNFVVEQNIWDISHVCGNQQVSLIQKQTPFIAIILRVGDTQRLHQWKKFRIAETTDCTTSYGFAVICKYCMLVQSHNEFSRVHNLLPFCNFFVRSWNKRNLTDCPNSTEVFFFVLHTLYRGHSTVQYVGGKTTNWKKTRQVNFREQSKRNAKIIDLFIMAGVPGAH